MSTVALTHCIAIYNSKTFEDYCMIDLKPSIKRVTNSIPAQAVGTQISA